MLEEVARCGLPNGFGPQRFGTCRNNHLIAETLVLDQPDLFFERISAPAPDQATPRIREARAALGAVGLSSRSPWTLILTFSIFSLGI